MFFFELGKQRDVERGDVHSAYVCRARQHEVLGAEDGSDSDDVVLRRPTYGPWRDFDGPSSMMRWMIEAVSSRQYPPELADVIPVSSR
jgi:hypothetical protein